MSRSLSKQNTPQQSSGTRALAGRNTAESHVDIRVTVNSQVAMLEQAISEILYAQRAPVTEQQLIQLLSEPPYGLVNAGILRSQLGLFQLHFLIFHSLYRLREREPRLLIHTLHIGFTAKPDAPSTGQQPDKPYADRPAMSEADCKQHMQDSAEALSRYYLDIEHLYSTSSGDVEALMNSFWSTFERHLTEKASGKETVVRGRQQD